MTTFAEQHLERWPSFAELSTKRGKIVPQRPTIKVKLFSSTHFSFWTERLCWCVFVVEKERDPRPEYTVKLYPVADSNIQKKQTRCSLECNFSVCMLFLLQRSWNYWTSWFLALWKMCEQNMNARLWCASWKAWTVLLSLARRRCL